MDSIYLTREQIDELASLADWTKMTAVTLQQDYQRETPNSVIAIHVETDTAFRIEASGQLAHSWN